jgi:hypothetical protein
MGQNTAQDIRLGPIGTGPVALDRVFETVKVSDSNLFIDSSNTGVMAVTYIHVLNPCHDVSATGIFNRNSAHKAPRVLGPRS